MFLTYPLFKGRFINRWLLSVPVEAAEASSAAPVNLKKTKKEWVEERRSSGPPDIKAETIEQEAEVSWDQQNVRLRAFFPFDETGVDMSGFWSTPVHISAFASTVLIAGEEGAVEFDVHTCGGMAVWLNGVLSHRFEPFSPNSSKVSRFSLLLRRGENRLDIWWDDLVKGNMAFFFRLLCPDSPDLLQGIPIGRRDPTRLRNEEAAMASLAFARNHFSSGEVTVRCHNPHEKENFAISFTLQDGPQDLGAFSRIAWFAPGKRHAALGKIEEFPPGFLCFRAEAAPEGFPIGRYITMESHPEGLFPPPASSIKERKQQVLDFLARYGRTKAVRAIALFYSSGLMEDVQHLFITAQQDDLSLVLLPHGLRKYKDDSRLEGVEGVMKDCILNSPYWEDEPAAGPRAFIFYASQFLWGELYPGDIFSSGRSGRELAEQAGKWLDIWFDHFFAEGFDTWNSPTELPVISSGLACLYADAPQALRDKARKGLDFVFYTLGVFGLEGYFAGATGRTRLQELLGNYSNETTTLSFIEYGTGNSGLGGPGALSLCLSSYEIPSEYTALMRPGTGEAMIIQSTQGSVNLYGYKTRGFILSSANDFRPGERGCEEQPLRLIFTPEAQVWINHPGEAGIYGAGRPSYWNGNSILPRVNQYKAFASVIFDIPPDHPRGFTHLYFPTMEFLACRANDHWIFGNIEEHYFCGIYAAGGMEVQSHGPHMDREFISQGRRNIWLIRVVSQEEFPTFNTFVDVLTGSPLKISPDLLSFCFQDPLYQEIQGGFHSSIRVEGTEVNYSGFGRDGIITTEPFPHP